jgi:chromosome segregation ATPase
VSLQDKIEKLEATNAELEFKLHDFETGYAGAMKLLKSANEKIAVLEAKLKEHEQSGLIVYGRKIETLNNTIRVLEAKLERCKELNNLMIDAVHEHDVELGIKTDGRSTIRTIIAKELAAITADSIKDNAPIQVTGSQEGQS